MKKRIEKLLARYSEVEELLGSGDAMSDKKRYKELVQEHSRLGAIRDAWNEFEKAENSLKEARDIIAKESDPDLLSMAKEEIEGLEGLIEPLKKKVEALLVPPDPRDSRNIIIELRAGTGGDEAALFVGDCVRMYQLYAANKGWSVEQLSAAESEVGGYKEFVMGLSGPNVFRFMQYEAGTHRVQRVPKTETQGRVHTSAITVAILLEPGDDEPVDIDEKDLRIDTYRSSGAGGQHVNTTDSAVRITHIPTGVVTYCQDERSQHKNKAKAMRMLVAKIAEEKRRKEAKERADLRASQVGTGDRSERIRTYNFSQNRVTDHRIDLTLYKLDQVMQGDLDEITQALVAHYYHQMLTSHE